MFHKNCASCFSVILRTTNKQNQKKQNKQQQKHIKKMVDGKKIMVTVIKTTKCLSPLCQWIGLNTGITDQTELLWSSCPQFVVSYTWETHYLFHCTVTWDIISIVSLRLEKKNVCLSSTIKGFLTKLTCLPTKQHREPSWVLQHKMTII